MKLPIPIVATLLCIATCAGAATFNVNSTLDEIDATTGDGSCSSTPSGLCTLRAAIMEANVFADEDTIILPAGVYTLTITGADEDSAASGDLDIRASVWISGAGTHTTIIDAAGIDRVVEVLLGDTVSLQDLTIRNGSATSATSYQGGGVYNRGSANFWLTRVRLTGNLANTGGGLSIAPNAIAYVQSCTIDGNALTTPDHTNAWGAAVYSRGDLRLTFSTVTGNSNASGTSEAVHLDNCSSENSAISASSIAANNTGGVHAYGCDLTLRNATIVNNAGPGLRFAQYEPTSGFTLTGGNNIFADNSLSDCTYYNATPSFLHSLDSDNSCGLSVGDGDLPATDPVLLPLRNWGGDTRSMHPKPGESPVIDTGTVGYPCTAFDQRLVPRPMDGDGDLIALCDMGSVEAGDLILWSGFEDGTTDEWSSAATF